MLNAMRQVAQASSTALQVTQITVAKPDSSHTLLIVTKPGREAAKAVGRGVKAKGYWYSFPKESQGNTWKETVQRRIKSACLAQAWRDEAGGCPDCNNLASSCVADCIQSKLVVNGDDSKLKATWDRAFSNTTLCPDEPFPSSTVVV